VGLLGNRLIKSIFKSKWWGLVGVLKNGMELNKVLYKKGIKEEFIFSRGSIIK